MIPLVAVSSVAWRSPGGNITGLTLATAEMNRKRLELLKAAVPGVERVAMLTNPSNPSSANAIREALVVQPDPTLYAERTRLAALAAQSRLPAVGEQRGVAEAGGLLSYASDIQENFRRAAGLVVLIRLSLAGQQIPAIDCSHLVGPRGHGERGSSGLRLCS